MSSHPFSGARRTGFGQVLAFANSLEKFSGLNNRRRRKDVARRLTRRLAISEVLESRCVMEASNDYQSSDQIAALLEDRPELSLETLQSPQLRAIAEACSNPLARACGSELFELDLSAELDAAATGESVGTIDLTDSVELITASGDGELASESIFSEELIAAVRQPVTAIPVLPLEVSENGPSVSTVLTDAEATAAGSTLVLENPPTEGTVTFASSGQGGSNPTITIGASGGAVRGSINQDQNGNGVTDTFNSDGRTGLMLFGDTNRADWLVTGLGGTTRVVNQGQFRGTSALATEVTTPGTGMRFTFRAGASQSLQGIDTLRFWVRAASPMNLQVIAHQVDNSYPRVEVKNVPTWWTKVEIPISQFGSYNTVIEYLLFSDRATTFYVDEFALLGPGVDGQTRVVEPNPEWGVNLFHHADWATDGAYTDAMRTMRRWGPLNAPWLEPNFASGYTSDGVPREPAAVISSLDSYEPGVYQLRYQGTGNVTVKLGDQRLGAQVTMVPGSLRREGQETVAEFNVPLTGTPILIQLLETNSSDPVRRIRLLAPGYHGATQQTYTDSFLNRLRPFSSVRMMNYSRTNDAISATWATRRLPTDSIQTTITRESEKGGVAWELLVDMANEANVTPWINVPHRADDNYIEELAKLWRDRLRPDSKLIVEFSNEIWNYYFTQFRELNNADYYNVVAPRIVKIREIFNRVWGAQANRVEVVLAGQAANRAYIDQALKYFQDKGLEPKNVVSAISVAIYATAESSTVYDQFEPLMRDVLNLDSETAQAAMYGSLANQYGLKLYAYEAGQHLQRYQVANDTLFQMAQDDPRMGELIPRINQLWRDAGGDMIAYFSLSGWDRGTSDWGLLKSMSLPGSYKWDAMMQVINSTGDANLDGQVNYLDFQRIAANYDQTNRFYEQGDFDGDRRVSSSDLRIWWESTDETKLSSGQIAEINSFATQRGVQLPNGRISLQLSSTRLSEGANGPAAQLTIRRTGSTAAPATVQLTVDRPTEARVQNTVEIPAGASFITIPLYAVNDGLMDGNQIVKLTAQSATLRQASTEFTVTDVGLGVPETSWVNATIYLDANNNGLMDSSELVTRTDGNGQFLFPQVPAGTYRIRELSDRNPAITLSAQTGITYTPSASLQSLPQGATREIEFSYRVRQASGILGESRVVRVTVRGENDLPESPQTTILAAEDGPIIFAVLPANDPDSDDTRTSLSFQLLGTAPQGVAALTTGGTFSFNPLNAFQELKSGETQTIVLPYRVTDKHGASVDSTITILVSGANDEERLVTNTGTTVAVGTARMLDTTMLSASDAEGDAITYVLTQLPQFGRLELVSAPGQAIDRFTQADLAAGSVLYRHFGNNATADLFDFNADDGQGTKTAGRFSITISRAATAPPTPVPGATVVGRYVYYNRSSYDNNSLAITLADSKAIAPDKRALLPGETASFANYTSYSRGLNGVMLDLKDVPNPSAIRTTDFVFRVGNSPQVSTFTQAPWPRQVSVLPSAGVNGSTRIIIAWDDNRIQNQWLQVTMLANSNTGLNANEVHYWGNSIGDVGNASFDAAVNQQDRDLIRLNRAIQNVNIDNKYDLDRNRMVDSIDFTLAKDLSSPLQLIRPIVAVAAVAVTNLPVEEESPAVFRSSLELESERYESESLEEPAENETDVVDRVMADESSGFLVDFDPFAFSLEEEDDDHPFQEEEAAVSPFLSINELERMAT